MKYSAIVTLALALAVAGRPARHHGGKHGAGGAGAGAGAGAGGAGAAGAGAAVCLLTVTVYDRD
jgi:hypothetical protein